MFSFLNDSCKTGLFMFFSFRKRGLKPHFDALNEVLYLHYSIFFVKSQQILQKHNTEAVEIQKM